MRVICVSDGWRFRSREAHHQGRYRDEARSWDSRYFGPIPAKDILFVVEPVLTVP